MYSAGDWPACFKCKRGMYFSKFSGSLNETCFYYGFSASSYAQGWLENYGIFLFIEHLLMEPFVVRLVCFASPLFARSRSGRVELGRIRYSDPVLVLSESDEVP